METTARFSEEACFNVYWKIKNFSFFRESISSPEHSITGDQYSLMLQPGSAEVECRIHSVTFNQHINLIREISFLTCDESPAETISGGRGVYLRVPLEIIFKKRRKSFLPEDTLTVRLRYPTDSERGKVFISSQIGVNRKYFLWTLKDFSNCQLTSEKSVEKSERHGDIKLTLKSVGGFNSDEQFYIQISRTGGEKCYYILKISLLDLFGKSINGISDEFVFEKEEIHQTRVFPAFFKKSEFLACRNPLQQEDTVSLKCNFAISLGALADQTYGISYCEDVVPFLKESEDISNTFIKKSDSDSIEDLQGDLKSILEDGTLHDVSLHVGSEVIGAHKSVLSARSPVFRAMFTKDMKEANSNTVLIEDFDVDIVRGLLLYMYTDTIHDFEWETMKKMYYAADKYEVLGLKKKCVSFLKTNLSISNVCEALVLADLHQDEVLKAAAIDFIFEHDSAVFESKAWKELEKNCSSLVIHVLREAYSYKKLK